MLTLLTVFDCVAKLIFLSANAGVGDKDRGEVESTLLSMSCILLLALALSRVKFELRSMPLLLTSGPALLVDYFFLDAFLAILHSNAAPQVGGTSFKDQTPDLV